MTASPQKASAPKTLARIAAPIGLDIGSKSPAEIAVSIMAQIVERLRKHG